MNKIVLRRTWCLVVARDHLAFLDHVHEFDALQGGPGRTEGLNPQHRANNPFDGSMVLLD